MSEGVSLTRWALSSGSQQISCRIIALICLHHIEDLLRLHVLLELWQLRVARCFNLELLGDRFYESGRPCHLVLREKADPQMRSARSSACCDIRFCEMSTKVERKIASTDANIASTT